MIDLNSFQAPMRVAGIGASGGIGRAFADLLTQSSDHVGHVYRLSRQPLDGHVHIDLNDEASIKSAAEKIGHDGALDLVINATGLLHEEAQNITPEKTWRHLDPKVMAAVYHANCIAPVMAAKHFLPLLRRDGKSVFAALSARVGSIADNRVGGWHSYRAAKAGLNMVIRNLALEMALKAPDAIIMGLHPGTVATNLSAPFRGMVKHDIFSPEESATHLINVINDAGQGYSGHQWAWDGAKIPG